jgi:polyhydroxyalkanoate synthesis repressor PhaR
MKVLKRYANRRLYDAGTSKTVTLDDVARYIREGEEVRVVDNATGEDITVRVLGQTFLRITTEERSAEFGSFLLSSLIREVSQNLSGFLMRLIQGGIGTAWLTPEKLEKIVEDLVQRGELEIGEKPDFVNLLQAQLSQHGEQLKQRAKEAVSQLSDLENPGLEELSGRLEEVARLIKKIGR